MNNCNKYLKLIGIFLFSYNVFATTFTVVPNNDSFVRKIGKNYNYGHLDHLSLSGIGKNRIFISFDNEEIAKLSNGRKFSNVELILKVKRNWSNWKSGRSISLYPLLLNWSEDSITWNCSFDSNNKNSSKDDCVNWSLEDSDGYSLPWDLEEVSSTYIENSTKNEVRLNLTSYFNNTRLDDINGFVIKKTKDSLLGSVEFYSRESKFSPKLVFSLSSTGNKPPTAKLKLENKNVYSNDEVLFDARESYDDERIVLYKFYLKNGETIENTSGLLKHRFKYTTGNETVKVEVFDKEGLSGSAKVNFPVYNVNKVYSDVKSTIDINHTNIEKIGDKYEVDSSLCKLKYPKFNECRNIDENSLKLTAFYPDFTNEVTSSLVTTKLDEKIMLNYVANKQVAENGHYTLIAGLLTHKDKAKLRFSSKLRKRISSLNMRIEQLEESGNSDVMIHILNKFKLKLETISIRLESDIVKKEDLYTVLTQSFFNGKEGKNKKSFYNNGILFQFETMGEFLTKGQDDKLKITITNVLYNGPQENLALEVQEENEVKNKFDVPSFSRGDSFSFIHSSLGNIQNIVNFETRVIHQNRIVSSGKLSQLEIKDTTSPVYELISSENIFSDLVTIDVRVTDDLSGVDAQTIKLVSSGVSYSPYSITEVQNGYDLRFMLSNIESGDYFYKIYANDLVGNNMESDAIDYIVDNDSPIIYTPDPATIEYSNNIFPLEVFLEDRFDVVSSVYIGDQLIVTSNDKVISKELNLEIGTNTIRIVSEDILCNKSEKIINVIGYDLAPPLISFLSTHPEYTNSEHYLLSVNVDEISNYKLFYKNNNSLYEVSHSSSGIKDFEIQLFEGINDISVYATDEYGNKSFVLQVQVAKDSIQPNVLVLNDVMITNSSQFLLNFQISESNLYEVILTKDGVELYKGENLSSFLVTGLSEGENKILVKATDLAGNFTLKTVTIAKDSIAPVLSLLSNNGLINSKSLSISYNLDESNFERFDISVNGSSSTSQYENSGSLDLVLNEGLNSIDITAVDKAKNVSDVQNISIIVDTIIPGIQTINIADGTVVNGKTLNILGRINEKIGNVTINGETAVIEGDNSFSFQFDVDSFGQKNIEVNISDLAGNQLVKNFSVSFEEVLIDDSLSPKVSLSSPELLQNENLKVNILEPDLERFTYEIYLNEDLVSQSTFHEISFDNVGEYKIKVKAIDKKGAYGEFVEVVSVYSVPDLPMTAKDVFDSLPEVDEAVLENMSFFDKYSFIVNEDAIQKEFDTDSVSPANLSYVTGHVFDSNGNPLPGVKISSPDHPEIGYTYSRDDGSYDYIVKSSFDVTLDYSIPGYLPSQRTASFVSSQVKMFEDVYLVKFSEKVSEVNFTQSEEDQIITSNKTIDGRGEREISMVFQPSTVATMVLADGTEKSLDRASIRLTEYTVGENGPGRMPGSLPSTSEYTYAFEASIDEAVRENALGVYFDRPVFTYVSNFLDLDPGAMIPNGYYSRKLKRWIPEADGIVVKIINIIEDKAVISVTPENEAITNEELDLLGFSNDELRLLAQKYNVGDSFWRVGLIHFSPFDLNFSVLIQGDETSISKTQNSRLNNTTIFNTQKACGSVVDVENQSLQEYVPIDGTDINISYNSSYSTLNSNVISAEVTPISGSRVSFNILGERYPATKVAEADNGKDIYEVKWDGFDKFDRAVYNNTPVDVVVSYTRRGRYPICINRNILNRLKEWADNNDCNLSIGIPGINMTQDRVMAADGRGSCAVNVRYRSFADSSSSVVEKCNEDENNIVKYYYYDVPARKVETFFVNSPKKATFIKGLNNWTFDIVHKLQDGVLYTGDGSIVKGKGYIARDLNKLYDFDENMYFYMHYDSKGDLFVAKGSRNYSNIKTGETLLPNDYHTALRGAKFDKYDRLVFLDHGSREIRRYDSKLNSFETLYKIPGRDETTCKQVLEQMVLDQNFTVPWDSNHGCTFNTTSFSVDSEGRLIFKYRADDYKYLASVEDNTLTILLVGGDGLYGGQLHSEFVAKVGSVFSGDLLGDHIVVDFKNNVYITGRKYVFKVHNVAEISKYFGGSSSFWNYDHIESGYGVDASSWPARNGFSVHNDIALLHDFGGFFIYNFKTDEVFKLTKPRNKGLVTDGANIKLTQNYGTSTEPAIFVEGDKFKFAFGSPLGDSYFEVSEGVGTPVIDTPTLIEDQYKDLGIKLVTIPNEKKNELYIFNKDTGFHLATYTLDRLILKYSMNYNSNSELVSINDQFGNELYLERNDLGQVKSIKYNNILKANLFYNDLDQFVTLSQNSDYWFFTYNENNLLSSYEDPIGKKSQFMYRNNKLILDSNNLGHEVGISKTVLSFDSFEFTKSTALSRTDVIEHKLNNDGGSVKNLRKANGQTVYSITKPDISEQKEYGNGEIISSSYAVSPLAGNSTSYPAVITRTLPSGKESIVEFSKEIVEESGQRKQLIERTIDNGNEWVSTYDYNLNESLLVSPEGREVHNVFYPSGLVAETNIGTYKTQYSYNLDGTLATKLDGQTLSEYFYNLDGQLSSIISNNQGRYFEYDNRGRVSKSYDDAGRGYEVSYDGNGNMTSIKAIGGKLHEFTNNFIGQATSYNSPVLSNEAYETSYEYSLDKELTKIIYPSGDHNNFIYNETSGLLETAELSNETIGFLYNGQGQLRTMSSTTGNSISINYDGRSPASISSNGEVNGTVSFDQRADGTLDGIDLNNNRLVDFGYDKDKLLSQIALPNGSVVNYNIDSTGLLRSITYGNFVETLDYDDNFRLKSSSVDYNGNSISQMALTYNNLNQVATKNVNGIANTYSYDFSNQVISDGVSSYSWDFNGNPLNSVVDDQDRLVSFKGLNFEHDYNGNVSKITNSVTGEVKEFESDEKAILRRATIGSNNIEYIIDPTGRRIGKRVNGEFYEGFLYQDQLNPIAKVDSQGNVLETYIYGEKAHVPAFISKGGKIYRVITDNLGSVLKVVDIATGTVAQSLTYNTFGEILSNSNPGFQPFGYAGGLYDTHTGLTRFGARDYNPVTGRWMQKDPIGFAGGDTNLYRYVKNNPVNFVDPDGKSPVAALLGPAIVFEVAFDLTTFVIELGSGKSLQQAKETTIRRSPLNNLFNVGTGVLFGSGAGPFQFFANPDTFNAIDKLKNRENSIEQQINEQTGDGGVCK